MKIKYTVHSHFSNGGDYTTMVSSNSDTGRALRPYLDRSLPCYIPELDVTIHAVVDSNISTLRLTVVIFGRPSPMTVTPDTLSTSPAGPNTADNALSSYVAILLNTEAPHTHYASQMK